MNCRGLILLISLLSIVSANSFLYVTDGLPFYRDWNFTTTTPINAVSVLLDSELQKFSMKSCTFYLDGRQYEKSELNPALFSPERNAAYACKLETPPLVSTGYHELRISFDEGITIHDPNIFFVYSQEQKTDLSVIQDEIYPHGTVYEKKTPTQKIWGVYDGIPFDVAYTISDASGIIQDLEYYVTWYVDGKEYAKQRVWQKRPRDHLVAQEFLLSQGTHTITIKVDSENTLQELDEGNNEYDIEINVLKRKPGKEISISMFNPFDNGIHLSRKYNATWYIANIGEEDITTPVTITATSTTTEDHVNEIILSSMESGKVIEIPISCLEGGSKIDACGQRVSVSGWDIYAIASNGIYGFTPFFSNDPTAHVEGATVPRKVCGGVPFGITYYISNTAYLSDKKDSNTPELNTKVLIDGKEIYSDNYALDGEERQFFLTPQITLEEGCHNFYITSDFEDELTGLTFDKRFYSEEEIYGLICARECAPNNQASGIIEEIAPICEGVFCEDYCEGDKLYSGTCNPETGACDHSSEVCENGCDPEFARCIEMMGSLHFDVFIDEGYVPGVIASGEDSITVTASLNEYGLNSIEPIEGVDVRFELTGPGNQVVEGKTDSNGNIEATFVIPHWDEFFPPQEEFYYGFTKTTIELEVSASKHDSGYDFDYSDGPYTIDVFSPAISIDKISIDPNPAQAYGEHDISITTSDTYAEGPAHFIVMVSEGVLSYEGLRGEYGGGIGFESWGSPTVHWEAPERGLTPDEISIAKEVTELGVEYGVQTSANIVKAAGYIIPVIETGADVYGMYGDSKDIWEDAGAYSGSLSTEEKVYRGADLALSEVKFIVGGVNLVTGNVPVLGKLSDWTVDGIDTAIGTGEIYLKQKAADLRNEQMETRSMDMFVEVEVRDSEGYYDRDYLIFEMEYLWAKEG